jgi:hypothetical protein
LGGSLNRLFKKEDLIIDDIKWEQIEKWIKKYDFEITKKEKMNWKRRWMRKETILIIRPQKNLEN